MLKAFFKRLSPHFQMFTGVHELRKGNLIVQAAEHERLRERVRRDTPGNIACDGYKVYSQTDEDGIIDEVFRRVPNDKAFVEIGVQTGVECNSLLLLLKGWRGVWIEGNPAYARRIGSDLGGSAFPPRFSVVESFVRRDNVLSLLNGAIAFLQVEELDFLSVDIDGNDLHVMEEMMSGGIRPKVVCVEYHAKFPPPLSLGIRYEPDHVWDLTDYMGSSLQAFVDMFRPFEYRLITCNIPGINAFFVRGDLAHLFPQFDVEQLYQPYRHYLSPIAPGQPPSLRYLRDRLASAG